MDLKEEALLGDQVHKHWYYRAKLAALLQATAGVTPCTVVDVGAGAGFFSRALLEAGRAEKAICVDPGYPADRDEQVAGRPLLFRRTLDNESADGESADGNVDAGLVLLMDVLEHVEDDAALLRGYVAKVPPGARFLVTVPAFQWMWSGHDVFLGHYRRYTLPRLEAILRLTGLRIEFGSYYYGAVLPVAALFRLGRRLLGDRGQAPKSDMRPFGPVLNGMFMGACRAELPFLRMSRIAGLSVFALATKP